MGVLKFSFFLVAFIAYTQAKPVDPKLHIEIAGKPVADIDTSSLTPRGRKIVNEIMSEMQPIIEEADILTKKVKHDSRSMDPIRKDQYKKSMDALTKSIEHHVHHANKKLEKEIKTRTRSGGVDLNNVPVYHLIENALHKLQFIPEFVLCNIMGCEPSTPEPESNTGHSTTQQVHKSTTPLFTPFPFSTEDADE